jgi:hypothetical protein
MNDNEYHHLSPCDACAMFQQRLDAAESEVKRLTKDYHEAMQTADALLATNIRYRKALGWVVLNADNTVSRYAEDALAGEEGKP